MFVRATSFVVAALVSFGALCAQAPSYNWFPVGTDKAVGGSANTIPLWSTSATYQQIHDSRDMERIGKVVLLKGMVFRPGPNSVVAGRKQDAIVNLSHTKVDPLKATGTFATNLGTSPTMVFGSKDSQGNLKYTTISWSTNTKTAGVNQPLVIFPFVKSFPYISVSGHLCWEWRFKNSTSNVNGSLDATSGYSSLSRGTPGFSGTACTTSGKTSVARFSTPASTGNPWRYDVLGSLTNAPASAGALVAVGAVKQNANLGWCTNLQLLPFFIGFGKTDGAGVWNTTFPLSALVGLPPFQLHVQYAYEDKSKSAGLALSNLASYTLPKTTGTFGVTRIYKAQYRGTSNGDETATSGSLTYSYGLVTGFTK